MVFITATENKPEQHIFMKYKYIKKNIAIKQKLLYNIEEYKQKKVKIYESKHWMNSGFKKCPTSPHFWFSYRSTRSQISTVLCS